MDNKPITQKDIAKQLGLDDSTVSLALRNNLKISKKTRELVQQTASLLGYRLNAIASNLSRYRTGSKSTPIQAALAWLNSWPDPGALYRFNEFDLYWRGAKETSARYGYELEEFVVSRDMTLKRVEQILQSRGIQGILVPPHPSDLQIDFGDLGWDKFSAIRFGRSVQDPAIDMVTADQYGNMMLAYDHASKLGYQRIGMINVRREHSTWISFDSGYLRAQELRKIEQRIPIFYDTPNNRALNISRLKDWLEQYQIDAVITATAGVTGLIRDAGYVVGSDIGLAAMSILDTSIDAGINQHSYEIGRVAARNLIALIQGNERGIPELSHQSYVTGTWVDGKTMPNRIS